MLLVVVILCFTQAFIPLSPDGMDGWIEENRRAQYPTYKPTAEIDPNNPYNIIITEHDNWTRIDFDSLMYQDPHQQPQRYILFNKLPESCNNVEDMPYAVFLPGFGATPEAYGIGFPMMNDLITSGEMCCFHSFMPYFSILPYGGWWYTNNRYLQPENFLFMEIISVLEAAMGNKITRDVEKRTLMGHSMGGYGAVMNSMRTNMKYFGSTCGFNGGLYIWNLKEFQDSVHNSVLSEATARKAGPFATCNYTQPPYRYYADEVNFNTMIALSLAQVFNGDFETEPYPNNPYFSAKLFNDDCETYSQTRGFKFWVDDEGVLDESLFSSSPWNSPDGFAKIYFPILQQTLSNNLYLSATYEDEVVSYLENVAFSESLNALGIAHKLFLYNGSHTDPFPGVAGCLTHFQPRLCKAATMNINTNTFWGVVAAACFLLGLVLILSFALFRVCRTRPGYEEVDDVKMDKNR